MTVVFQGDSITDCGRVRTDSAHLGNGYASIVGEALRSRGATCFNRGISGNRVADLQARWQTDCLELQPDLVTLLIGINDTWRRYDSNMISPIEPFETGLEALCREVKQAGSKLILLEPFVLPIPADRINWREDLDPRIQAVRRVAASYADDFVPLDGLFAAAACRTSAAELAEDGVHPTQAGHRLIADALLAAIDRLA